MKRFILFFMITFPFVLVDAQGQIISKNLSLAGFVGYQTLYNGQSVNPSTQETIRDVASWRNPSTGYEYALVCLPTPGPTEGIGSGVAMVDVTNPNSPNYIKTIRRPGLNATNTPADVQVYNNVLFVAQNPQPTYWVNLVTAVDNSGNPTAGYGGDIIIPNLPPGTPVSIHNLFVNKEQSLLFLSYFVDDQKIPVYDISGVPTTAPVFKGEIPQLLTGVKARSHDLYARKISATQGRVFDASLRAITVSDYTWSGGAFTLGTQRAHQYNPYRGINPSDFSDPNKIMPLDNRIVHSTWLGAGSDYLFSNEEQFGGDTTLSTWISTSSEKFLRRRAG